MPRNPEAESVATTLIPQLHALSGWLREVDSSQTETLAPLLANAYRFTATVGHLLDWPVDFCQTMDIDVQFADQQLRMAHSHVEPSFSESEADEVPEVTYFSRPDLGKLQAYEYLVGRLRIALHGRLREFVPVLSMNAGAIILVHHWQDEGEHPDIGPIRGSFEVADFDPINDETRQHIDRQLAADAALVCKYFAERLTTRLKEITDEAIKAESFTDSPSGAKPVDDAAATIKRVALLLGSDGEKLIAIVNHPTFTTDQKLVALDTLDERFQGYKSEDLAQLLRRSESSVRNSSTWKKWQPVPVKRSKSAQK